MEQKNSNISRKVFRKHIGEIRELKEFLEKVKSTLNEKLICSILIGSRVRLNFNIGSDIDLILVGNWFNDKLFERINEIKEKLQIPLLPVDYFLYRPTEILKFIEQGNPMILDGFTEGICLFNNKYYQKIRKVIEKQISLGIISKKEKLWKIHN